MAVWRPLGQLLTRSWQHEVEAGFGHALLAPVVSNVFETLGVSASLSDGSDWFSLHAMPNLIEFELGHGGEADRVEHNQRCFATLRRTRKPVCREHAGYFDLFVPVLFKAEVIAALVVGPFARTRPSAAEIQARFRRLSARRGQLGDREFSAYLAMSLATLVVEGEKLSSFQRLVECLAELMAGQGAADRLTNEAQSLREELDGLRLVDRTWSVVSAMTDQRSPRGWYSVVRAPELAALGLTTAPDHLLVSLSTRRVTELDAVEAVVRQHEFQRSAVELARESKVAIAGRVGEHGVVFISGSKGSVRGKRQKLLDLAERTRLLAQRKYGLSLHAGIAAVSSGALLAQSYEAALAAAETALGRGVRLQDAETAPSHAASSLRRLRQELGLLVVKQPAQFAAHFDRYLEMVAQRSAGSMESVRTHLEVGFEQITAALLQSGALEPKSLDEMSRALDAAASGTSGLDQLFSAYRAVITEVVAAVQKPLSARHHRGLGAAVDYVRQHCTEPLRVERVARIAGFSPNYFSELFREREGKTFREYVLGLRVERARELLSSTNLEVTRVARLSGFNSLEYFARVFRRAMGTTPLGYRKNKFQAWRPVRDTYRRN